MDKPKLGRDRLAGVQCRLTLATGEAEQPFYLCYLCEVYGMRAPATHIGRAQNKRLYRICEACSQSLRCAWIATREMTNIASAEYILPRTKPSV